MRLLLLILVIVGAFLDVGNGMFLVLGAEDGAVCDVAAGVGRGVVVAHYCVEC